MTSTHRSLWTETYHGVGETGPHCPGPGGAKITPDYSNQGKRVVWGERHKRQIAWMTIASEEVEMGDDWAAGVSAVVFASTTDGGF